jgi:hypothetical protein
MPAPKNEHQYKNWIKNLSKSHKGKHCSPATEFKKGHKRIITQQTIEKMRKANLGNKNPMFGKKAWNNGKKGLQVAWNKGKPLSKEHRESISKAHKGKPSWNKGKGGYTTSLKGKKRPDLSGENHWNWKCGKSPKNNKIRRSEKYQQWRKDVFIRDHFTCKECGHRFIGIVAHHKKSFANYKKIRFDIDNGVTLCRKCHARYHGKISCNLNK